MLKKGEECSRLIPILYQSRIAGRSPSHCLLLMTTTSQIPSDVFKALVDSGGAQITLILGAGCSMENPPGLQSAAVLADQAYSRLVSEGVLPEGTLDKNDRWDLTKVADIVKSLTGSQRALTERLPVTEFINAMCNDGHRITVALMLEGAVANVVTLNYDKSMSHALSELGAEDKIRTVWGPENQNQIQAPCLVYLHRMADSNQEKWIIAAEAIEQGWKDEWEDLAALRTLLLPICIFVGLGSSVPVLTSKIKEIRDSQVGALTLQIDPTARSKHLSRESSFTEEAGISEDHFLKDRWSDFMKRLGNYVAETQVRKTAAKCDDLNRSDSQEVRNELRDRVQDILNRKGGFDLLGLGRVRAAWLNAKNPNYVAHSEGDNERRFATPLLLIDLIERTKDCRAIIGENGVVDFFSTDKTHLTSVQVVYGRGGDWWADIDAQTYHDRQRKQMLPVTSVIGYGLLGEPDQIAPPPDIASLNTSGQDADSIMQPPELQFEKGDTLYSDPDQIERLF